MKIRTTCTVFLARNPTAVDGSSASIEHAGGSILSVSDTSGEACLTEAQAQVLVENGLAEEIER